MITKEQCYVGICDNCGELFNDGEYSMFPLMSDVKDNMNNCDWYADGTDVNHKGKHYCPKCFKPHETDDDVIIVDASRFVFQESPAPSSPDGWVSEKPQHELIEEMWEDYSQHIGDRISELEDFAGKDVITERSFKKIIEKYKIVPITPTP